MRYAAKSLTIDEVMEPVSGRLRDAAALIGQDYNALICLRNELEGAIAAGNPMYVCPACATPLLIRCGTRHKSDPRLTRDFHFWHGRDKPTCPLSESSQRSREAILAAKYHGQREGQAHIRLKHLIFDSLSCDPRFTNSAIEQTWRLQDDSRQWRRPDVSTRFEGCPIVFEIQLSTTFVSVMAERRHFYRERGALLVWIIADFSPAWTALAHEDIFYPNNRNIFVAGDHTLEASRQSNALVLDVHWLEPQDAGRSTPDFQLRRKLVDFAALTRDIKKQRTYYFDVDAAEAAVRSRIADAPLRQAFESHWFRYVQGGDSEVALHRLASEWAALRRRFAERNVHLPERQSSAAVLLNSIYSVRAADLGQLVGWRYSNLVELAHHLFTKHKSVVWPFRLALQAFDRGAMIREHDTTGKLKAKASVYRKAIEADDPAYR